MAVDVVRDIYGSQKIENLLNLALEATGEERAKSPELEVGFDSETKTWELIIKYSGDLKEVRELAEEVYELQNEYAVLLVREDRIREMASLPEVEYIEKPKRLFFEVENGRRVSCIDAVQGARFALSGQGVLIGILDSGGLCQPGLPYCGGEDPDPGSLGSGGRPGIYRRGDQQGPGGGRPGCEKTDRLQ